MAAPNPDFPTSPPARQASVISSPMAYTESEPQPEIDDLIIIEGLKADNIVLQSRLIAETKANEALRQEIEAEREERQNDHQLLEAEIQKATDLHKSLQQEVDLHREEHNKSLQRLDDQTAETIAQQKTFLAETESARTLQTALNTQVNSNRVQHDKDRKRFDEAITEAIAQQKTFSAETEKARTLQTTLITQTKSLQEMGNILNTALVNNKSRDKSFLSIDWVQSCKVSVY